MRRLWIFVLGTSLLIVACARPNVAPPVPDVSGRWSGTWTGYGIIEIPREGTVMAELRPEGDGRLVFEGVSASEDIPVVFRTAGAAGARVLVQVSPGAAVMTHELGAGRFKAAFTVRGDRMVGRVRDVEPSLVIELVRIGPLEDAVSAETPR